MVYAVRIDKNYWRFFILVYTQLYDFSIFIAYIEFLQKLFLILYASLIIKTWFGEISSLKYKRYKYYTLREYLNHEDFL